MEHWASTGHLASYDPGRRVLAPAEAVVLQCRYCGFEPADVVIPPKCCPKCYGGSWERFGRAGNILRILTGTNPEEPSGHPTRRRRGTSIMVSRGRHKLRTY